MPLKSITNYLSLDCLGRDRFGRKTRIEIIGRNWECVKDRTSQDDWILQESRILDKNCRILENGKLFQSQDKEGQCRN